jgi:hypothetical protein
MRFCFRNSIIFSFYSFYFFCSCGLDKNKTTETIYVSPQSTDQPQASNTSNENNKNTNDNNNEIPRCLKEEMPLDEIKTNVELSGQIKHAAMDTLREACIEKGIGLEHVDFWNFTLEEAKKLEVLLNFKKVDYIKLSKRMRDLLKLAYDNFGYDEKKGLPSKHLTKNPIIGDPNVDPMDVVNDQSGETARNIASNYTDKITDPKFIANLREEELLTIEEGGLRSRLLFLDFFHRLDRKQDLIPSPFISTLLFTLAEGLREKRDKIIKEGFI